MRGLLQSAVLLGLSSLAAATYKDEVGHIDFHHSLVGVPQSDTTFFHRPRKEDKASLLYTLSDVGVVGAVNPSSGDVVWRQRVSDELTNGGGHLRAPEGESWVASAYGRRVHAWNAMSGRNVWESEFQGEVKDLEIMEVTENPRKDVLVLFEEDGSTVLRRLHGALGTVVWEFQTKTKDIPVQVSTNAAHIYVISLHGTPASYTLRVTSVDTATGTRVDDWSIGTKGEVHKAEDVMFVGVNSAAPFVAWTNTPPTKLSINILGTKNKQEFPLPSDTVSVQLHAPHQLQSQTHFLAHVRSETGNRGEVYHIDLKTNQVKSAFEVAYLPGKGAFSTSSEAANVYFTRVHDDEVSVISSEDGKILAYWRLKSDELVQPVQTVSEVIKKTGADGFAVRSALLTSSGDWIMIKNGEQDWTRHEGLSGTVSAVWAEYPETENLAKALEEEAHTNPVSAYIHRVNRHLDDLQSLPAYLSSIPSNVMASLFGGESAAPTGRRDSFGFNKIIVGATKRGRFFGLDSGDHGKVLWSTEVFPQTAGESLDVRGIVANDEQGIITVRGAKGERAVIKATTGEVVQIHAAGSSPAISSTAVISADAGDWLLAFGEDGHPSENIEAGNVPSSTVVVRAGGDVLKGVKFIADGDKTVEQEVWQLQVYPGQKIASIAAPPAHDPIASIGRVLSDRGVLYKYLNPNMLIVAVVEEAASRLSIQLVDSISGQILASQKYDGVDAGKSISCTTSENWYACSFYGEYELQGGSGQSIKGYQIVATDLYESPEPNDRGPLGDAANASSLAPVDSYAGVPLPWVVSQAWVISQPIEKLSVTQTRQGITNKMLMAYLPETHGIWALARAAVDPRRPVGRDPTPAEMEAEGLPKYAPAIEVDPRTVVSHQWDVLGIEDILTTTATVESTSLLVAYGIDIFGTRIAPSGTFDILGKSFDKLTLLGTVLALFVGVVFVAPMVLRKQINTRWEVPQ